MSRVGWRFVGQGLFHVWRSVGQGLFRSEGLLPVLSAHLLHPCPEVQIAAAQTASNMALNQDNQEHMQVGVGTVSQHVQVVSETLSF